MIIFTIGKGRRSPLSYPLSLFCLAFWIVSHNSVVSPSRDLNPMLPKAFATNSPCAGEPPSNCSISLKAVINVQEDENSGGVVQGQVLREDSYKRSVSLHQVIKVHFSIIPRLIRYDNHSFANEIEELITKTQSTGGSICSIISC